MMAEKKKWIRVMYIVGVAALILGIVDPMEGSVVIAAGSILVALSTWVMHDRDRKLFLVTMILIITGVFALFFLSSLGGFGGNSELSWWWGTLILPYPAGWLMAIILLITRAVRQTKPQAQDDQ